MRRTNWAGFIPSMANESTGDEWQDASIMKKVVAIIRTERVLVLKEQLSQIGILQ